ncbi:MAG: TolC family protein [Proteobacteria bacterium]|nr:TolC family protein [Pseudomonadota bacterium]
MDRKANTRSIVIPTVGRKKLWVSWVALMLCCAAGSAWAQAPLTEAAVVRLARSHAPGSAVAQATERLADARQRTAGLLLNPFVGWERETVLTGQGSAQDIFRATIAIDMAGPLSNRSLAASRSSWMRAEASVTRTAAVLDAVLGYYDVVVAERRVAILRRAVSSLDEAARVLARREEAGNASGYESTRLAIASELARSRQAEAQGTLHSARARLAALLGLDVDTLRVDTTLALSPLRDEAQLVRSGTSDRAAIRQARASARFAAVAQDRAGWTWVPTLNVSGGANLVSDPDRRHGYVVALSLSIPIFDRGQGLRAEAEAQRALSTARAEALSRTVRAELASSYAIYTTARQELARFEAATSDQVDALLRAAQSGYREGQRSIVELLDAQRAQTDVAERRLSLLGAAKQAEARLRAAAGELR